jgi:hypothetical protein
MSPDTPPPSPISLQYWWSVICFAVLFVATPRPIPPQSHLLRAMINGSTMRACQKYADAPMLHIPTQGSQS